jgi:uncharacterized protein (TIGR03790 family)
VFFFLLLLLATRAAQAGGSGLNVIVVVNQRSPNSLQLGNDYCERRGVPPQNFLRVTNWTGGNIAWSPAEFQTNLLNPLLTLVAARGLTNQAQFVVLSMDIPYRVADGTGQNSTTAALFYGFKTNGAPVSGIDSCSLPDNSSNSYAFSEMPFAVAPPNTATTNSFLALMLTDTNLAAAENTLVRGVAADFSAPTQTVYLAKTTDLFRNVRFTAFDNSVFENQVVGNFSVARTTTDSTAFTNLTGLMTGLAGYTFPTNAFLPGALGDTLTSFGGEILEASGQTPVLAFLEAGAAGSYGTVVEPCNYLQKFPDPVDYFYQARGFTVAEAYYQSVLNPFEGLFVGEPLAAPFAQPGSGGGTSPTNGAVLSGAAALNFTFTAARTNLPLAQVDLFVDGIFFKTLTNLPPAAGNVFSATLNGHTIHYTVPANATLATAATGLANAINFQSGLTKVGAFAAGDRIELQSLATYVSGSNVTVSAATAIGSATKLTTRLTAARPTCLNTIATGYQTVQIYGNPLIGDWLKFSFLKTNGTSVTLAVTNATGGTSIGTLAQNLVNLINTNGSLQAADGLFAGDFFDEGPFGVPLVQFYLYAQTAGWPAAQMLSTLTSSTNLLTAPTGTQPLADNVSDLRPRNHLYVSSGTNALTVNAALDTTQLADGWHELTAVAYEGTSVRTQTKITRTVQIQNTNLTASLAAQIVGTNSGLLQFTVTANVTNLARIELFSTGGSVGVATNLSTAVFSASVTNLGIGVHPYFALVTDAAGHRYQTQTFWSTFPVITLTLTRPPLALAWPAIIGRQYELQSTTNLTAPFAPVATITATNSLIAWPLSAAGSANFFRVKLAP